MKKTTKTIVAILIVIALVAGASYVVLGSNYFEEPNQFGSWGQRVLVNYADGSQESLSLVATNPVKSFSVKHEDTAIVSITYELSARATGVGYTSVDIDYSLYSVRFITGSSVVTKTFTGTAVSIPLDNVWYKVCSVDISANEIQDSLPAGTYTMSISGQGSIKYKGNVDTAWSTASNPSEVTFDVTISTDFSLVVEFKNGVSFTPNNPTPPIGQFEDFTTYTEVDAPNYFTPTTTSIIETLLPRSSSTEYIQKAKAIGTGAFTLKFDVIATRLDGSTTPDTVGGGMYMLLTNNILTRTASLSRSSGDGIMWGFREYTDSTGVQFILMQVRTMSGAVYSEKSCSINTLYQVTISKSASGIITFTLATGGATIHTGTLSGDTTNIQYFTPACGASSGSSEYVASGTISNVAFS